MTERRMNNYSESSVLSASESDREDEASKHSSRSSPGPGSLSGTGSGSESGSHSDDSSCSSRMSNSKPTEGEGSSISSEGEGGRARASRRERLQRDNSEDTNSDSAYPQNANKTRTDSIRDIIREAAVRPDLYGMRRSHRPRSQLTRLSADDSCSDEDEPNNKFRARRRVNRHPSDSESHNENSNSDSDGSSYAAYGKAKKRRRPQKRARVNNNRQIQKIRHRSSSEDDNMSSGDYSESEEEKRKRLANKRLAAQTLSYKEQSDQSTDADDVVEADEDDDVEVGAQPDVDAIERVMRHRTGRKGATGAATVVYVAEQDGDPNDDESREETEVQYWIKWKGWAHIHNTWESENSLRIQNVAGLKRLENYQKKERAMENRKYMANPEEREYIICQQEMEEELQEQYSRVDRIVRRQRVRNEEGQMVQEYLVKWQGLQYSECTDEDAKLINRLFPKAVDDFERRLRTSNVPNVDCKALKYRPKFQPHKSQPLCIGRYEDSLKLRDYQLDGLNWLLHSWCKDNSVILADEMGLGKTLQTISFIAVLMDSYQVYGPFLVLVPLSTITAWEREFTLWTPHINVIQYVGDVNSRNRIREEEFYGSGKKQLKFNVLLTTYETVLREKVILGSISWAMIIVDEAHRLKNEDSLLYKCLMAFKSDHRLLITGTPLQNSLKELWALLHFLMPRRYDKWEDFEAKHVSADKTGFCHLHKELEPFLLRRVKKDVEKSLPAKVEQILRVEMSKIQKQYYRWILTKNFKALTKGNQGKVSSFINIAMELKKCCNHASLISPDEVQTGDSKDIVEGLVKGSGKLILLDKLLRRLKESGHRVLIFSQMVRMLDILARYLQFRRFPYQRLDGSIRGELRKQALDHFNAPGSPDFCFLLSTRAGGLGVNLATADTVIIYDSDWNPQNDLQAQARAHRIGQKNQVSVYRLVTKNSMEEEILERAKKKMILDHLVIQRMDTTGKTVFNKEPHGSSKSTKGNSVLFNADELNAILRFGAEDLFNKDEEEEEELQVDIDDILRRAEMRNTEDLRNSTTDELLSQFKVVSFDNLEEEEIEREGARRDGFWENIIPEEERRKIDEEELHEKLMVLNPPPRSRKNVSKPDHRQSLEEDEDDSRSHRSGRKRKFDVEEDKMDSEVDSITEDIPRKRGRPRLEPKKQLKDFGNSEVRQLIKSMKKFPRPLDRVDAIAQDAGLQDKPHDAVYNLIDLIINSCQQTLETFDQKSVDNEESASKSPPTFKLSKVTINARSVKQAMTDLEPLAVWLDGYGGTEFPKGMRVKDAHFDCPWSAADDMNLLRGVADKGLGTWTAIKSNKEYNLSVILPEEDARPQARHLQTRFDYLMRSLHKHLEKMIKHSKKHKSPKQKPAEVVTNGVVKHPISPVKGSEPEPSLPSVSENKNKKKVKEKSPIENSPAKVTSCNVSVKPVPTLVNETPVTSNDKLEDPELPEDIFLQCKEKMRPVKKALKRLGLDVDAISNEEHLENTRKYLLKIGDHINCILAEIGEVDEIRQWRSNLWHFVSKFTEFDAKRLHKLYRHMTKKRELEKSNNSFVVNIEHEDSRHGSTESLQQQPVKLSGKKIVKNHALTDNSHSRGSDGCDQESSVHSHKQVTHNRSAISNSRGVEDHVGKKQNHDVNHFNIPTKVRKTTTDISNSSHMERSSEEKKKKETAIKKKNHHMPDSCSNEEKKVRNGRPSEVHRSESLKSSPNTQLLHRSATSPRKSHPSSHR